MVTGRGSTDHKLKESDKKTPPRIRSKSKITGKLFRGRGETMDQIARRKQSAKKKKEADRTGPRSFHQGKEGTFHVGKRGPGNRDQRGGARRGETRSGWSKDEEKTPTNESGIKAN